MKSVSKTVVVASSLVFLMLGLVPIYGATYTLTVQSDKASYAGAQRITISGTISPAPGPSTAVFVQIMNPSGAVVDVQDDNVDATTGAFTQFTVAGGTASWVPGTYTVNATWGGNGASATKTISFAYGGQSTTNTTSAVTTATTTVTATVTTTSVATTSTTSTATVTTTASTVLVATSTTFSTLLQTSTQVVTSTFSTAMGGQGAATDPTTLLIAGLAAVVALLVGLMVGRGRSAPKQ